MPLIKPKILTPLTLFALSTGCGKYEAKPTKPECPDPNSVEQLFLPDETQEQVDKLTNEAVADALKKIESKLNVGDQDLLVNLCETKPISIDLKADLKKLLSRKLKPWVVANINNTLKIEDFKKSFTVVLSGLLRPEEFKALIARIRAELNKRGDVFWLITKYFDSLKSDGLSLKKRNKDFIEFDVKPKTDKEIASKLVETFWEDSDFCKKQLIRTHNMIANDAHLSEHLITFKDIRAKLEDSLLKSIESRLNQLSSEHNLSNVAVQNIKIKPSSALQRKILLELYEIQNAIYSISDYQLAQFGIDAAVNALRRSNLATVCEDVASEIKLSHGNIELRSPEDKPQKQILLSKEEAQKELHLEQKLKSLKKELEENSENYGKAMELKEQISETQKNLIKYMGLLELIKRMKEEQAKYASKNIGEDANSSEPTRFTEPQASGH